MKPWKLGALTAVVSMGLFGAPDALAQDKSRDKAQHKAQHKIQTYTVKKGDTCTSIARKFYGDAQAYHHIHEHNDLSAQGYACRPGTRLELPILPDLPEARVLARAGDVRARPPKSSWNAIDVGAELFEAWRVNTLTDSRAELGFQDSSELQMTENTLVVIYGPDKKSARRTVARRARVDKGRLKSRLAGLSGKSLQVDTPSATATFTSGDAQVTVDAAESRIANHSGSPVDVASPDGSNAVAVKAGHGSRVKLGKPPEKPRPLPPTPTWGADFSPQALSLGRSGGVVRASWKPVSGADAYYVEVSRDRRQIDVIFSKKAPASITALEMRQLPPGDYFVSIVSIDADKFESIPTKLRALQVFALKVAPTQIVDLEERSVMLGATLEAPRGMTCGVGDAPIASSTSAAPTSASSTSATSKLRLRRPGTHEVTCTDGEASASTTVQVVKPTVTVIDSASRPALLTAGAMGAVGVRFHPGVPDGVEARTAEGLDARPLQIAPDTLRINLTAANDANAGDSVVELYVEDVRLGAFDVEVTTKGVSRGHDRSTVADSEYFTSALLGYDAATASPYWRPAPPQAGGTLELGLGAIPSTFFAAEVRLGGAVHIGDAVDSIVSARAQAMAGVFDSAAAPYAALGLGWHLPSRGDTRASVRAAAGLMPAISERVRIRCELAVDTTPIDGTLRYLPQGRVGLAYRF